MKNPKVLILYTGGTIGMVNSPETGELKAFDFERLYNSVPELSQFEYELDTCSTENPIDSSEMNPKIWAEIAKTIFDNYVNYDGFVVLHGSDTMAYSASALSFMLQGLKKPVIFTGSQLPIGMIRTDGKENFITAVEIAGLKDSNGDALVQEVAVYFEYSLYRGNRTTKRSTSNFEAFKSHNYPLLAEAGVEIDFDNNELYRTHLNELVFQPTFSEEIGLVKLFPGMAIKSMQSIFDINNTKGVVIESFGSGNTFNSDALKTMMQDYIENGGIILVITQCGKGKVSFGKYETSRLFTDLGAISGKDLTTEAAVTKMMHVLGTYKSNEERRKYLEKDLCGELTN